DVKLNEWALAGNWRVEEEKAISLSSNGKVVFRFHSRDLHLVVGPGPEGRPIHFRVTIDGEIPGENHGIDTDASGEGIMGDQRLYQLIRQSGEIRDRTFS